MLCKFDFFLDDNTIKSTFSACSSSSDAIHDFNTPTGKEFAGFLIQDALSRGEVTRLAAYYNPAADPCVATTAITLNLSNIAGTTKNLFDGVASSLTFVATKISGCPAMEF